MTTTTANAFRAGLKEAVDHCIEDHEPIYVRRKRGSGFIVIGEEDWKAIEETLYLNRIPGLVKSVHQAAKEPLGKGVRFEDFRW